MDLISSVRTQMLLGSDNLKKLKSTTVAVFGLGGVGSFACEAIARAGVGNLILVDSDAVDASNLNRQLVALSSTIGEKKTDVMERRILDISPDTRVFGINKFYEAQNREDFFAYPIDYVVDAIDTVASKADLILSALERAIPVASAMGTGNKLHPELFKIGRLEQTSVCPLCKKMRYILRGQDLSGLWVVYSEEAPIKPLFYPEEGKRPPGSVSFVPPAAGMLLASVVIRGLLGIP